MSTDGDSYRHRIRKRRGDVRNAVNDGIIPVNESHVVRNDQPFEIDSFFTSLCANLMVKECECVLKCFVDRFSLFAKMLSGIIKMRRLPFSSGSLVLSFILISIVKLCSQFHEDFGWEVNNKLKLLFNCTDLTIIHKYLY